MLEIYQISLIRNNEKIEVKSVKIRSKMGKDKYVKAYRKKNGIPDDVIVDLAYKEKRHGKEN
jgi:hypothetical protein